MAKLSRSEFFPKHAKKVKVNSQPFVLMRSVVRQRDLEDDIRMMLSC
jgi:hypothetical protein